MAAKARQYRLSPLAESDLANIWQDTVDNGSASASTAYRDARVLAIIVFMLLLKPDGLAGIADRRESETP